MKRSAPKGAILDSEMDRGLIFSGRGKQDPDFLVSRLRVFIRYDKAVADLNPGLVPFDIVANQSPAGFCSVIRHVPAFQPKNRSQFVLALDLKIKFRSFASQMAPFSPSVEKINAFPSPCPISIFSIPETTETAVGTA